MKNIFKILITGSVISLGVVSCNNDEFDNLNNDPKYTKKLPSKNLLASTLYSSAKGMYSPSVNSNNYRFFVQQLSETTYTDETNYDLVKRSQPRRVFNDFYTSGINRLKLAKEALDKETNLANVKLNKWATLEIQELFIWETLVDTYGDLPYFEAFKSEEFLAPKYDDALTIYKDLLKRIDEVVAKIDVSVKGYGDADFIYHGDMNKWKKFANSLKLRLGVNLADVEPALSKTTVEAAVNSGVISSDAESYTLICDGSIYANPVYDAFVQSGRSDFVPSDRIVDMMNDKKDPRRAVWFTKVGGEYKGGVFGASNGFSKYSHYTDVLTNASAPMKLLSYTEVSFLLAEASARGYSVGGDAKDLYEKAVKNSMAEWGVAEADVTTYLGANAYDASNWQKSIGEQAYVALFDRAFPVWNFVRRLDFPKMKRPEDSVLPEGVVYPVRMPYSSQEYQLNGTNVKAAATAIGGDKAGTKLFWDKN